MKRFTRSILMMAVAPVLIAGAVVTPAANAWVIGGDPLVYEYTDARWKTVIPVTSRLVSGTDTVEGRADNCSAFEVEYRRNRTLLPTQLLIQLPLTSGNICGWRSTSQSLDNLGTQNVFGKHRAMYANLPGVYIRG